MVFKDEGKGGGEEYALLCPGAKHPPKLRWSPKASQGLQVPALTTSPHLLCATPLESIKHFIVAAACKRWLPAPEERPALGLPPLREGFSIFALAVSKGGRSPSPAVAGSSLVVPK